MPEPILQTQQNQANHGLPDQKDTGGDYFTPYTVGIFHLTNKNDLAAYDSKFDFLSPSVEKILFDFSTAEFIEESLGTKFNLSRIQKKDTANLIREILLGELFIGDFIKLLMSRLNLEEPKAKEVASEITAKLFPSALESIKRTQRVRFASKIQELVKSRQEEPSQNTPQQPQSYRLPLPQTPPITPAPSTTPTPQQTRPPLQMPPRPKIQPLKTEVEPQKEDRPQTDAQKSLEEELEKVASVIDLRSKSE